MRYLLPRIPGALAYSFAVLCCCLLGGVPLRAAEPPPPRFHFRPATGWFGDAHPIYFRGEWWVYYLRVPAAPFREGLNEVHSALAVSSDLIDWREVPIRHTDPNIPWWAIAVFTHEDGLAAMHNRESGWSLVTSRDGLTWSEAPGPPPVPYAALTAASPEKLIPRDPNVFRDANGVYYLTLALKEDTVNQTGAFGRIGVTTSTNLTQWGPLRISYNPGNIGVPECPEVFNIGARYYLLASWGWDQVGQARWRWSDTPGGPWHAPRFDTLDGPELQAPNSASDGQRRMLVGWVPSYSDNADLKPAQWGGDMALPRELYADASGQLYLRAPKELDALREHQLPVKLDRRAGTAAIDATSLANAAGADYAEAWLPSHEPYHEVRATFTLGPDCPEAGIVLQRADTHFAGYSVTINAARQMLEVRTHHDLRRTLSAAPINIRPGEPLELRVLVDGGIVEAFLGERWSVIARTHRAVDSPSSGVYVMRGECRVTGVEHHRLRQLFPLWRAEQGINLQPTADPARSQGGDSVLFPRATSNVHIPHHSVLDFRGPFSLACDVWVTPGTGGRKTNLIIKGDGTEPGYHYGLNLMPGRAIEVFAKTSDGFVGLTSAAGTGPAEGKWTRLLATIDPPRGLLVLYVDGREVGRKQGPPFTLDPNNQGALRLGRAAGLPHSNPFFGAMDNVRLWDRVVDPAELQPAAASAGAPPIAAWDFNAIRWPIDGGQHRPIADNLNPRYPALRAGLYDGALVHDENAD